MARPKLEGRVTVPTGDWTISVTDSGGTDPAITVSAGDYYLTSTTSLLTTLQNALNASGTLAGTYTVAIADDADTDTGKVTISATGGGNISITWTATGLRDVLGFDGNVSGAASHTGAEQAEYLFLPGSPRDGSGHAPDGDVGIPSTDLVMNRSTDGTVVAFQYEDTYDDSLGFQHLRGHNVFTTYETTVNESLQTFWGDVFKAGLPFRYHKDRSVDATYVTWRAVNQNRFLVDQIEEGWHSATALFNWRADVIKDV